MNTTVSFFDLTDAILFFQCLLFFFFFHVGTFPFFRKYNLHVCYVFNVIIIQKIGIVTKFPCFCKKYYTVIIYK